VGRAIDIELEGARFMRGFTQIDIAAAVDDTPQQQKREISPPESLE
jgi:hypothetical protein